MCVAMCSARFSTSSASPMTTSSIASSNSSGKRDMWTPFCDGSRSTVQSISAAISFSPPPWLIRIAFWIPRTPARESPSGTSEGAAWRSCVRSCLTSSTRQRYQPHLAEDPDFARLVMLACHDLRTPLATVHGFAQTLGRSADLDETSTRYVEMINAASGQLADLLDELSVAARVAAARYDPPLRAVDTLELARAAAERLGEDRVAVSGEGAEVEIDRDAVERAVASLARCALRHGGLERVELT